ncbi:hypothetical protein QJQ45_025052, partial [Haematococcus lacustris]
GATRSTAYKRKSPDKKAHSSQDSTLCQPKLATTPCRITHMALQLFNDPLFGDIERTVSRAFQPYFGAMMPGKGFDAAFPSGGLYPMDIHEHKDRYSLVAGKYLAPTSSMDLPALLAPTSPPLTNEATAGDTLVVSGEKKSSRQDKHEEGGVKTHRRERTFTRFTRAFVLPEDAKPGNISARIDNGVLTVDITAYKRKPPDKKAHISQDSTLRQPNLATTPCRITHMALQLFNDPLFGDIERTVSRAFQPYFGAMMPGKGFDAAFPSGGLYPMDIHEHKDRYSLVAGKYWAPTSSMDLPALLAPTSPPLTNEAAAVGDTLVVSGEKKSSRQDKHEEGGVKTHRRERTFTRFTRAFVLPEDAKPDNISARIDNGVLTVDIQGATRSTAYKRKSPDKRAHSSQDSTLCQTKLATTPCRITHMALQLFNDPLFGDIERTVSRAFQPYFGAMMPGKGFDAAFPSGGLYPMDIHEHKDRYSLVAGNPEQVHVELQGDTLVVSGEKKSSRQDKHEEGGVKTHRRERTFTRFTRAFVLPEDAKPDNISARIDNGVLTVDIQGATRSTAYKRKSPDKRAHSSQDSTLCQTKLATTPCRITHMALQLFNDPLFGDIERTVSRAFQPYFGAMMPGKGFDAAFPSGGLYPMDIHEHKDAPGFSPEQVHVELQGDTLVVSGEKKSSRQDKHEEGGVKTHRRERTFIRFTRAFVLPEDAKPDNISARIDNGVLTVDITAYKRKPPDKKAHISQDSTLCQPNLATTPCRITHMALQLFNDPLFGDIERTVSRAFQPYFGAMMPGKGFDAAFPCGGLYPMDIHEHKDRYSLVAGNPEQVHVELQGDTLVVSGEKKSSRQDKHEEGGVKTHRRERTFTRFTRAFVLPEDAKPDNISACIDNGVLTVDITAYKRKSPDKKAHSSQDSTLCQPKLATTPCRITHMALQLFNDPLFGDIERTVSRAFQPYFGAMMPGKGFDAAFPSGGLYPMDIHEHKDAPGFSPEQVHVELQGDTLVVSGEKKSSRQDQHEEGGVKTHRRERTFTRFTRAFVLPEDAKPDNISARIDNGVLTVDITAYKRKPPDKKAHISQDSTLCQPNLATTPCRITHMALQLFNDPLFGDIERTVSRAFQPYFGAMMPGKGFDAAFPSGGLYPMDIHEHKDRYSLVAGNPEQVHVELQGDTLVVSGEKKSSRQDKHEEGGVKTHRRERTFTRFTRAFVLPEDAKPDNISACIDNGVLTVDITAYKRKSPDKKAHSSQDSTLCQPKLATTPCRTTHMALQLFNDPLFGDIERTVSRAFQPYFGAMMPGKGFDAAFPSGGLYPMDIHEHKDAPGFSPEQVHVELQGDTLVVSGEKKSSRQDKHEEGGVKTHRRERTFTRFTRAFVLPEDAKPDNISARIDNGVLTVDIQGATRSTAYKRKSPDKRAHSSQDSTLCQTKLATTPCRITHMALQLFNDPLFGDIERTVSRAFQPYFGAMMPGKGFDAAFPSGGLYPMDIHEHKDRYSLVAGNPEQVHVELQGDTLVVSGEKKSSRQDKHEEGGVKTHRRERTFTRFTRAFVLPEDAKPDNISARIDNGVLTVDITAYKRKPPDKKAHISQDSTLRQPNLATTPCRNTHMALQLFNDPLFGDIERTVSRAFQPYFGAMMPGKGFDAAFPSGGLYPMDIHEHKDAPGFSPEQVHVELQGDTLVVSGEKKSSRQDKHEEGGVKTHRRERTFTRFTRAFVLPEDAKPDNISARIDNGVLTVDIQGATRSTAYKRKSPDKRAHSSQDSTLCQTKLATTPCRITHMALQLFNDPLFGDIERTVSRAFQPYFGAMMPGKGFDAAFPSGGLYPMDIHEHKDRYSLVAGNPEQVHVELQGDTLVVSGEKKSSRQDKHEEGGVKTHRRERTFTRFTRAFVLPEDAKPDNISARIDNGVLTVDITAYKRKPPDKKAHISQDSTLCQPNLATTPCRITHMALQLFNDPLFGDIERTVSRAFQPYFGAMMPGKGFDAAFPSGGLYPMDIHEHKDAPGFSPEQVHVELQGDTLVVSGEKKSSRQDKHEEGGVKTHRRERTGATRSTAYKRKPPDKKAHISQDSTLCQPNLATTPCRITHMALQLFNDPLFGDIERTVSRAFQPYFGAMMPGKGFDAAFPSGGLYPMDIHEHKDAPGFSPEQVHVELQGDTLVVSGEKKSSRQDKHEEGGVKTHRRERTFTRFTRAFVLPEDAKPDNISACIDNGVLTVDITAYKRKPPDKKAHISQDSTLCQPNLATTPCRITHMALQLFNDPLFGDIERTVSRAFQPYFGAMMPGKGFDAAFPSGGLYPMDIHEHKDAPGFSPEQVHVELQGDTLVVSGEKKSSRQDKHEEGGVKTHRRERTFTRFTRAFVLPEDAKPDNISACIDNGVLTVDITAYKRKSPDKKAHSSQDSTLCQPKLATTPCRTTHMALQLFNDPLFGDIERTVSRAFQPYFGAMMPGKGFDAAFPSGGLYPMDIHEHKDAPGFSPEQVHVELQGDTLVVSGEKKSSRQDKHEEGGVKTHRRERTFTRFTRAFVLPEDAKPDNISARIDNGVLTVDIPKEPRAPPQPRRITVQAAGADAASQPAAGAQQKAAGSNGSA